MAEPKKSAAFRVSFTMISGSGVSIAGLSPAVRVARDASAFAAAANAVAAIGSGFYTIVLTAQEMSADAVCFRAAGSSALTYRSTIYPHANITADVYSRIGATGSGLTTLAQASMAAAILVDSNALDTRLTAARAGYLDNIQTGAGLSVLAQASMATAIMGDTSGLDARLTAGRATNLDNLSAAAPTAGAVADAVWDEVGSGHGTSYTMGWFARVGAGMANANSVIDQTTYNAQGLMTAGRVRLFQTAGSATAATDGGSGQGEFATFDVATVAETGSADRAKTIKVTLT